MFQMAVLSMAPPSVTGSLHRSLLPHTARDDGFHARRSRRGQDSLAPHVDRDHLRAMTYSNPVIVRQPPLDFTASELYTLGVEVELQIVDRATGDLTPKAPQLIEAWTGAPNVHPELFKSMIELNTGICRSAREVERDLRRTMVPLMDLADAQGLRFISTGTHPTARYQDRAPFPSERFDQLIERNQWIVRRLLIFGLHVHVGMPDGDTCIAIQNELLYDLGLLLAVSASSPFWQGERTGLASSRITMFESMPTGGTPAIVRDWLEFSELVAALTRSRAITSLKDFWWDIRPSPAYGTLELRACDGLASIRDTCAVVALVHALARRAGARIAAGKARPIPPPWLVRENKWRAARHGMNAALVTDVAGATIEARELLDATLDDLGCEGFFEGDDVYVADLREIAAGGGTSADRQIAVFEGTGDMRAVTQSLADYFEADVRR
jgi:carboxylate-amine ligase